MRISLAGPKGFEPGAQIRAQLNAEGRAADFKFTTDPHEAFSGADIVYTDVWTSMGKEEESEGRAARMRPYAVTAGLFAAGKPDAPFMDPPPAPPGHGGQPPVRRHGGTLCGGQARRAVHALPPGPSGPRGRAGRPRQPALGGLRRGGEPAARAEGNPRGALGGAGRMRR